MKFEARLLMIRHTFFGRGMALMPDRVENDEFYSDNEGVLESGIPMPQARWPIVVQSISGIPEEDWTVFKDRCRADNITQGKAMELAVADLAIALRRGDRIDWRPSRSVGSKPVRMHDDTINEVRQLAEEYGFLQNAIFSAAMHRWATRA